MYNVRQVLQNKGYDVWSVSPDTTTYEALRMLDDKDIGALMVLDGERMVGIISERDFARRIARRGACHLEAPVKEFMTRNVYVVSPEQTIEECMVIMTQKHFRHLPVIEEGKLVGIISIGDVVSEVIKNQEDTIHNLEDYILGTGYGH